MPVSRSKETVTRIDTLDGVEIHRDTCVRYVYAKDDGTFYIKTLGYNKKVEAQADGTFIERQDGKTIHNGSGLDLIRAIAILSDEEKHGAQD